MKFNLIDSNYNSHSGFSLTTIKTKYGIFTGTSQLYEEDKKIASSFRGCQYAEMKAIRKAYKAEIIKTCEENLDKFSVPREIVFLNDLPHTPLEKVDFMALEKLDK